MKISTGSESQFGLFRNKTKYSRYPSEKMRDRPEFDFILEEILREEIKELDDYPVLLPRHGRFWDNGYEDVE